MPTKCFFSTLLPGRQPRDIILTILIPDGQSTLSTAACIAGAAEMFTEANAHWRNTGREPLFTIELGGSAERCEIYNGHVTTRLSQPI